MDVFFKISLAFILFLSYYSDGTVIICPQDVAPVCSGDQLELNCTITGRFLEWSFNAFPENGTAIRRYSRVLSTASQTSKLQVNSTVFMFSRISVEGSTPLSSTLLISGTSTSLDGIMVNCGNREASELLSTTIDIIKDPKGVNITSLLEEYENYHVAVTLEWTEQIFIGSYFVYVIPPSTLRFTESAGVQFNATYNTLYYVNIVAACGQSNATTFIKLHYTKCGNPENRTSDSVKIMGYQTPGEDGSVITFSCSPGLVLKGPNTSVCMENGKWEPDPMKVKCKVSENGDNAQGLNIEVLIVSLASSMTLFTTCSIFLFFVGYMCGHCQRKKRQTSIPENVDSELASNSPASTNISAPVYEDIDILFTHPSYTEQTMKLNANVAYGPV